MKMERIYFYIIFFVVLFIILKATTFGWRSFRPTSWSPSKEDSQLAEILKSHVFRLSEEIGDRSVFNYKKLEEAAEYISEQFSAYGYEVKFQRYRVYNKEVRNIIATKEGVEKPKEVIIVGAHYDTCFNPGADDNASAVAGLLELARFISEEETGRTIKFIAFVNEEPPFFMTGNMGSRVYAKAAKKRGEDIKGVIIFEMIGYYSDKPNAQRYPIPLGLFYPNRPNFITAVSNWPSREFLKEVVASFKKHSVFPMESLAAFGFVPGLDFSDHWSFWQEGFPAIMVTDTSFYRYPYYHRFSDTYEKLDYERMAAVVKGFSEVLIELSQ